MIPHQSYIIESILATGLLYLIYMLALRNRPMLVFNRFVLLLMIVLGIVLPLIKFQLPETTEIPTSRIILEAIEYSTADFVIYSEAPRQINYWHLIYLSVTSILLVYLLFRLIKIQKFRRKSAVCEKGDFSYHLIQGKYSHFSFFKTVFINDSLVETEVELNSILEHEKVHVKQKHTFDILFLEFLKVFLWFNPFLWLLKKCVTENHEYLADRNMLKNTSKNIVDYFNELLHSSLRTANISLANNFNHSILKKRVVMMTKKIKMTERLIPFMIVPVIFSLGIFFACSNNEAIPEIQELMSVDLEPNDTRINYFEARSTFNMPYHKYYPDSKGNKNPFSEYLQKNLVYPKEAIDKKIGGIVWVEFDVTRKGKIENVEIIQKLHPLLDAEALRVVKSCPDWDMGVAATQGSDLNNFRFPVFFDLNMDNEHTQLKKENILYKADVKPRFKGGDLDMFRKYLEENIEYPKEALDKGIMGWVSVQFVVRNDGKICDAQVKNKVDPLLKTEALRLINSAPNWTPGKLNGKNIDVQFNTRIGFFFGEKKLNEIQEEEEKIKQYRKEYKSFFNNGFVRLIIKKEGADAKEKALYIQYANNIIEHSQGEAEFTFDLTGDFKIENIITGLNTNILLATLTENILHNNVELIKEIVEEPQKYKGKLVVESKPATDIIIKIK